MSAVILHCGNAENFVTISCGGNRLEKNIENHKKVDSDIETLQNFSFKLWFFSENGSAICSLKDEEMQKSTSFGIKKIQNVISRKQTFPQSLIFSRETLLKNLTRSDLFGSKPDAL